MRLPRGLLALAICGPLVLSCGTDASDAIEVSPPPDDLAVDPDAPRLRVPVGGGFATTAVVSARAAGLVIIDGVGVDGQDLAPVITQVSGGEVVASKPIPGPPLSIVRAVLVGDEVAIVGEPCPQLTIDRVVNAGLDLATCEEPGDPILLIWSMTSTSLRTSAIEVPTNGVDHPQPVSAGGRLFLTVTPTPGDPGRAFEIDLDADRLELLPGLDGRLRGCGQGEDGVLIESAPEAVVPDTPGSGDAEPTVTLFTLGDDGPSPLPVPEPPTALWSPSLVGCLDDGDLVFPVAGDSTALVLHGVTDREPVWDRLPEPPSDVAGASVPQVLDGVVLTTHSVDQEEHLYYVVDDRWERLWIRTGLDPPSIVAWSEGSPVTQIVATASQPGTVNVY